MNRACTAIASLLISASAGLAQASFAGLGHFPQRPAYSEGLAISADGSTAVGSALLTSGPFNSTSGAYRWSESSGFVSAFDPLGASSSSSAVSADGSVIVGWATFSGVSSLGTQAFVYRVGLGTTLLGDLPTNPGSPNSYARGVSADGSVIVGIGQSAGGTEGFVYRVATGQFTPIGSLSAVSFGSWAYGVSGNGQVLVGASYSAPEQLEAMIWTQAHGLDGIGFLFASPSPKRSEVFGANFNGSVVVGRSTSPNAGSGMEAFRWTDDREMTGLGDLPGGPFSSVAYAVSGDGNVVVGSGSVEGGGPFGGSSPRAFIWDAQNGMRDLKQVLEAAGASLTGWTLREARGISADGRTIVGTGQNPVGEFEAWIATFPAPQCYPNCDGSAAQPVLNIADFICFLNRFAAGDAYANCDGSTASPVLNVGDFICYLNAFAAGCP